MSVAPPPWNSMTESQKKRHSLSRTSSSSTLDVGTARRPSVGSQQQATARRPSLGSQEALWKRVSLRSLLGPKESPRGAPSGAGGPGAAEPAVQPALFEQISAQLGAILEKQQSLESRLDERLTLLEASVANASWQARSGSATPPAPGEKRLGGGAGVTAQLRKRSALGGEVAELAAERGRGDSAEAAALRAPPPPGEEEQDESLKALLAGDTEVRAMLKDVRAQVERTAAMYHTRGQEAVGEASPSGVRRKVIQRLGGRFRTNSGSSDGARTGGDCAEASAASSPAGSAVSSETSIGSTIPARDEGGRAGRPAGGPGWCGSLCGSRAVAWLAQLPTVTVLHPDAKFRTSWNVGMSVLISICGVVVPLEIAFEDDLKANLGGPHCAPPALTDCPDWIYWELVNYAFDAIFIFDIYVNLRTGYVREGHFVNNSSLAACQYLRHGFFLDFLGSFPLNLFLSTDSDSEGGDSVGRINRLLRLLRLFKLMRMFKLAKYMEYLEFVVKFNPGLLRIFKLFLVSLLCCHWVGCAWWLVSDIELDDWGYTNATLVPIEGNRWLPYEWLRSSGDFGLKYTHSFLWGAGMITSLVPKDVEPITGLEVTVTVLTMFLGLLVNAFLISSFTSAFASMDSKQELIRGQLDTIRQYLIFKSVPSDLKSRVLEYYEYVYTSSQSMEDLQLLRDLPPNLSTQLAITMNRRLIVKCPFFAELSNSSLMEVLSRLIPLIFVPGQVAARYIPSHTVAHRHTPSRTVTHRHAPSHTVTHRHTPLHTVTHHHAPSRTVTHRYIPLHPSDPRARGQPVVTRRYIPLHPVTQVIVQEGSHLREIYFINRGIVQLCRGLGTDSETDEGRLVDHDNFGMDAFMTVSRTVPNSARAVTYCDVMALMTADLSRLVEKDAIERARLLQQQVGHVPGSAGQRRAAWGSAGQRRSSPPCTGCFVPARRIRATAPITDSGRQPG